jgi:hypothetical protein
MPTPTKGKADNGKNKPLRLTKRIGQTTYKVNVHFSETSKETMSDKVVRLIRNEAVNQ